MPAKLPQKLTPRQKAFVREYLIDLNAGAAAERAGYSPKIARKAGCENLQKPLIAAAVQAAMQHRAQRVEITADRVLQELARVAFFDPRRLLRADGTAKPVHELDDDTAAAVAGLEIAEITGEKGKVIGTVRKYRLVDKGAAITTAMRHLGMLRDVQVHAHTTLTELLRLAEERRAKRDAIPG